MSKVLDVGGLAFGQRLLDRRIAVDTNERPVLGQARHRHVQRLAVMPRAAPHRQLWCVRVGFDHRGRVPLAQLGEALRRGLGAAEVRDPPASAGETGSALVLERPPDPLTNPLLGLHGPTIAAGQSGVFTPLRSISIAFATRRSRVASRFASAIQRAYSLRWVKESASWGAPASALRPSASARAGGTSPPRGASSRSRTTSPSSPTSIPAASRTSRRRPR